MKRWNYKNSTNEMGLDVINIFLHSFFLEATGGVRGPY